MRIAFIAMVVASTVVLLHGQTRKVDFTQGTIDQPPKGFEFGHTGHLWTCARSLSISSFP